VNTTTAHPRPATHSDLSPEGHTIILFATKKKWAEPVTAGSAPTETIHSYGALRYAKDYHSRKY